LLIGLLGLINFPLAWTLLLSGCVLLGLLAVMRKRADSGAGVPVAATVPWFPGAGAVIAIIFLLYGPVINASLSAVFPVSSLEVRPGLQSTLDVVSIARQDSLRAKLLGSGPNTFGVSWLAHKPAEVNKTPFWNLDFNVGYSTLATAFGGAGLLGALAWLMPLFLLVAAVIRAARLGALSREERFVSSMLVLAGLFLSAAMALYVPSQNIVLLCFVLSGAAFGFLWRQGRTGDDERAPSMLEGLGVLLVVGVLLVGTAFSGFTAARRLASQAYVGAGLYVLAAGDTDAAIARAESAQNVERTADALRLRTDAGAKKLSDIAQNTKLSPEDARKQFTAEVQKAISAGQAAVLASPTDYRAYFSLGRVYDLLSSLKIEGAYQSARASYSAAAEHNPTSPSIPLALARLEAAAGNTKGTQENITRALTLKPDYTDAILFVVQINIANNDLASAIQNTQIAVQTAPGVASLWFQLGLLYYAGGDAKNSVAPLERALALEPGYANAKYFLGLSYHKTGRQNDALRLFRELSAGNPDNAEVKAVIANLAAGKDPLDGLEPPTAPQDRQTAPIAQ